MYQKWDVVIVGGGLAGYVAANYLAKSDLSILLLEQGISVGGRARTYKKHHYYFNLGPHALYKRGMAKSILEELGIPLHGSSPKLGGKLFENHFEYAAPFTPTGLFSTRLFNWKERIEWVTVMMKVSRINIEKLAGLTFEQWVQQIARSLKVQSLLYVLGRLATYCHAPEKVSAKVIVGHMKDVLGGVLYLDGGWQTIIDQLHNKAVLSGVHVQTNTKVNQISRVDDDQLQVSLSGEEKILAKYVICTTGPHELTKITGEMVRFEAAAVKGATLDIALSELPNPENLFAMGVSIPLYFAVHSEYARLSEDGNSAVLHVFKYHHPDDAIDRHKIKTELEQFLEKMQPGWRKYLIASRFLPNIIVNQRLPLIGDEHKLVRSKTELPGLYIAGDWASPHSILAEGAIRSGMQAAEEIILHVKR